MAAVLPVITSQRAAAQAVDLGALGLNWDFELPALAHVNTAEATSTGNIGPGWTLEILSGTVSNHGVQDPNRTFYGSFPGEVEDPPGTFTGGTLPAPFQGRQLGFMNLNAADSMAQIVSIPVGSLVAGQTYTLNVAVGARATDAQANIAYAVGLRSSNGTELGTLATTILDPAVATATNITDLTYTLNVNTQAASFIGQDVSIFIRGANGGNGPAPNPPADLAQANFDNVRLSGTLGAVNTNAPLLTINRTTGGVTLSKSGGTNYNITGYQLSSDTYGSFNQANWITISSAYDASGNQSVDNNNNWTVLAAAGSTNDLSEAELQGGDGGTLSTPSPINLGTPWRKTPYQDVTAKLLLAGGTELTVPVQYTGTAIAAGDLNGDGAINPADWTIFKSGQAANYTGLSLAQSYLLGDMNGDRKHDLKDFGQFRAAYNAANGGGAFEAMVAVPEPAAMLLAVGGAMGLVRVSRRRRLGSMAAIARPVMAIAATLLAVVTLAGSASAQTTIAHWTFDTPTITTGATGILTAADTTNNHNATSRFNGTGITIDPVAGQFGQAATFNNGLGAQGTNNAYMDFPQLTEIMGPSAGDFSVAVWTNVPDNGATAWDSNTILADWGNAPANTHRFTYWFSLANVDTNATLRPRAQIRAANAPPDPATIDIVATTLSAAQAAQPTPPGTGPTAFDDATWHHLAWTWTKATGEMKFYTDGVLRHTQVSTAANKDLLVSDSLVGAIGGKRDNNRYFRGTLDELWVLNGALTDQQVANLRQFNNVVGNALTLRIDQTNGQIEIRNDKTEPLDLTSYKITSASGGLDLANWNEISSQSIAGFPSGSGNGMGWEVGPGSSNSDLTEYYLTGTSTLAPGASVNLGSAYNQSLDATDVVFKYTGAGGSELTGVVEFGSVTAPSNPADFNGDGSVNGADLTIWKNNFGSSSSTKATGSADGDADTDGNDFLLWQRNVGATGSTAVSAAVPEPAGFALLSVAGLGLVMRRRRLSKAAAASPVHSAVALPAALAVVLAVSAASAAVTIDRRYRLGEEPGEGGSGLPATLGSVVGSGNTFMTTWDSQPPGFHDLLQNGSPVYVDVGPAGLARPGATASENLGVQFDGTDDYLRGLRFNFPGNSASSTLNCCNIIPPATTPAPGPNNYVGLSNRGFQVWVRPEGPAPSRVQNVVLDTNQHGLLISATNTWTMRYNGADTVSTEPVAFNAWSHAMVVRPYGIAAPTGGSILYINGKAVAARAGNYNADQEFGLVVGADTGDGAADPFGGDAAAYYKGVVDELSLFTMGRTFDGVDRGTFNFRTDNTWAATHLTAPIADVTQNGTVDQTDVNTMITNWKFVNLVNGVQAGDITTITKGDLNFDGAVNLRDAAIMRTAIGSASAAVGIDLSLLPVPEPSTLVLLGGAALAACIRRRR